MCEGSWLEGTHTVETRCSPVHRRWGRPRGGRVLHHETVPPQPLGPGPCTWAARTHLLSEPLEEGLGPDQAVRVSKRSLLQRQSAFLKLRI